jgi:hypothetical protein
MDAVFVAESEPISSVLPDFWKHWTKPMGEPTKKRLSARI